MPPLPTADLEHVLNHTRAVWEALRGARIFLTGGTGFYGVWLCETFTHAVDRLQLDTTLTVLTRDIEKAKMRLPHLAAHHAIAWQRGDVRGFDFPSGSWSHVLHAATPASADFNENAPLEMFDTIVGGTRHVLDFAVHAGVRRFLLASSGAVYGRQPAQMSHVDEEYIGAPSWDDPNAAYAQGKRAAEWLCGAYCKDGIEPVVARGWAFVGPHLPLDTHFAIGNFIRDGLQSTSIRIGGDGTPLRSYLYAADLAIWLWTMLVNGQAGRAYNVGSPEAHSIREIAESVAACFLPAPKVLVAQTPREGVLPSRYTPSVQRARDELNLEPTIELEDAIRRTISWYQRNAST
ncbi:MAG: dTDP-glucose 4,6-dehydratase [Abditibacteriota bacterium]|nr:dTDP-glucose 4,6-dehydratase [Abditibacteriota bacterium]